MRAGVLLCALSLLASCASPGSASRASLMSIVPGQSREDVIAFLGQPGDRTFRGSAEALTYCRSGLMSTDDYSTIWLVNNRVVSLTTMSRGYGTLNCTQFPEIDWGQAPPDVRIAIENSN